METKEHILCAAYRFKEGYETPNMKKLKKKTGKDVSEIYYEPHREVFSVALGWRHPDILYKYGDCIDKKDTGGFLTSLGRYVDRHKAAKIAFDAGQIDYLKATLYSEDIY